MAKIMLCDDSKTMLLIFEKKLKDAGHEIVGKAADGEEGIKLYNEKRPELTLLDITMPNKDGREALQGILKINTAAKVIMVSALKEEEVINECLKSGAKAFIRKTEVIKDEDFKREVLSVIEKVLKTA